MDYINYVLIVGIVIVFGNFLYSFSKDTNTKPHKHSH